MPEIAGHTSTLNRRPTEIHLKTYSWIQGDTTQGHRNVQGTSGGHQDEREMHLPQGRRPHRGRGRPPRNPRRQEGLPLVPIRPHPLPLSRPEEARRTRRLAHRRRLHPVPRLQRRGPLGDKEDPRLRPRINHFRGSIA